MSNVTAWVIVLADVAAFVGAGVVGEGVGAGVVVVELDALEEAEELPEELAELESEEYRLMTGAFWILRLFERMRVTRFQ